MASALFELVILSLPSALWARRLRRSGVSRRQSLDAVGLRWGPLSDYGLALGLVIPVTAIAAVLLTVIPSHVLHGGSKNVVGAPSSGADYVAIASLALAEEVFFRGFVAGVLFRRLGFARGNVVQSALFLAPHTLLLFVSVSLWPLLPAAAERRLGARLAAPSLRKYRPRRARPHPDQSAPGSALRTLTRS